MSDLISQRVFQIACAYEDANDCDLLRFDPAFKAACGRLPISGTPLASQPTMSRLENGIRRRDLYRIAEALVDGFIASYKRPPNAVVLDIDDTDDEVYGCQQLAMFNGYYGERCYCPLHIYEGPTGRLITTLFASGRPSYRQTDCHRSQATGETPSRGVAARATLFAWRRPFFLSRGPRLLRRARGVFRAGTDGQCQACTTGTRADRAGKGTVSGDRTACAAIYQFRLPGRFVGRAKTHHLQSRNHRFRTSQYTLCRHQPEE